MRLVDADALKERLKEYCIDGDEQAMLWYDLMGIDETIDEEPTIDAIPVVRCKDCKWFDKQRCVCHNPRYGDGYANYQPPNTNDEYWCADGERKDDDTD